MKAILGLSPRDQLALAPARRGNKHDQVMAGMSPKQQETLLALGNPQQVVSDELLEGKLLEDIYSERQLLEVMTDKA